MLIELAGGIMVPLNNKQVNLDLLIKWKIPVILVSKNYLGSINHTLLSIEILKSNKITIAGIIFSGKKNKTSEELILKYSKLTCLAAISLINRVNKKSIKTAASKINTNLF